MSDYSEYYEFYKKHWEKALSEKTEKVNLRITELESKLAKAREALEFTVDMLKASQPWVSSYGLRHDSEKAIDKAREALKEMG